MGVLSDLVEQYFKANDWDYECSSSEEGLFLAGIEAENSEFDVVVHADDSVNQLTCFCICQEPVPEEMMKAVAEYIIRVNFSNVLAVYDMDFDEGSIRMRSSINVVDMTPTPEMVDTVIHGSITMADVYYPGLMAVIAEEMSPEEAYESCMNNLQNLFDEDDE